MQTASELLRCSVYPVRGFGESYLRHIDAAFESAPPVYLDERFGSTFRMCGRDPSWLAALLASDAHMEGYSAVRLWQYATAFKSDALADRIRQHASDERRHSLMFGAMLLKVFPSLPRDCLQDALRYSMDPLADVAGGADFGAGPSQEEIVNSMVLMNLYEFKALVLCKLTRPLVLAHAPADVRPALARTFERIERDEARHIAYTAEFLDAACLRGRDQQVRDAMKEFQQTINRVTAAELDLATVPSVS